jgi:uncharacterized repeat protein (TIGR03803 family)
MNRIALAALLVLVSLLAPGRCLAAPITVHAFNGTDGKTPYAGLILGTDGNFYGTTSVGGTGVTNPAGTVFKMTADGTVTTLLTFDFQVTGDEPHAGVVRDGDGKLYGTTRGSGAYNGSVFRVGGGFQDLHAFSGTFGGGDGAHPEAGVVIGPDGKLWGTTSHGGAPGVGTVFRVGTDGAGYAVVHSFTGFAADKTDGTPLGGLVNGGDGNLYGTTSGGGTTKGTVFRITTAGVVTTIHRFVGTDGSWPSGDLFRASDGKLYGTTQTGGAHNAGTIYRIATDGTFTSLHSFDTAAGDGSQPEGGVIEASDGNFYGTTYYGGIGLGTVFVLTPDGGFATLASFTVSSVGWSPRGALVQGPDGFLYGANSAGGDSGCGTIYKLAPGVPTTTTSSTTSSTSSSTSTSSTTATLPPTTSSTTTTPTPSTLVVTTSTAGQLPNPTTTTLPSSGCGPDAATFASVLCRLEALRAALSAENGLGAYQSKLGQNVDKALGRTDEARDLCATNGKNDAKKAKKRLLQVKKALTQYAHTLKGQAARKKLDGALRETFLADGEAIVPDVTKLRTGLACPADAAP